MDRSTPTRSCVTLGKLTSSKAIAVSEFLSREIVPLPQPTVEVLETHQTSYEFYQEVRYRQAFDEYCQWYYAIAEQHRRDLQKMRREINLVSWFWRTKAR